MANPYPVRVQAGEGGPVVVAGELTFTDPANQPGNGGSSAVAAVRVPLTSAEILNLGTTQIEVVAAPGPGLAVIPINAAIALTAGLTPYTVSSFDLYYSNPATLLAASLTSCKSALGQSVDFSAADGAIGTESTNEGAQPMINQPLVLFSDASLGDGTAVFSLVYATVAMA